MKKIKTHNSIEITKIYKTYPKEIERDVPKLLIDFYKKDFILCLETFYRNLISYGGMFMNLKNEGKFLAEYTCLKTKEKWFGGIYYHEAYGLKRLTTPKYKYVRKSKKNISNRLVLLGGNDSLSMLDNIDKQEYDILSFSFTSDNIKDELERHLEELKKIVRHEKNKTYVITDWYLKEILKKSIDGSINKLFKSESDLVSFLEDYEFRVNEIISFKKLILCYYYENNNIPIFLGDEFEDEDEDEYEYEYGEYDYEEFVGTYGYILLKKEKIKKTVNEIIELSNTNFEKELNNIHDYILANNFYINLFNKIPSNTYLYDSSHRYRWHLEGNIEIDRKVLEKTLSEKRYVNLYLPDYGKFKDFFSQEFLDYKDEGEVFC